MRWAVSGSTSRSPISWSEAPDKAILTGVTFGRVVNTVTIEGVPCDHLFFSQPPGIELEL
jgi:hypothetical protein